ncbi:MAG: VIT domain-containing protein [Rhizomicrobium sp.]
MDIRTKMFAALFFTAGLFLGGVAAAAAPQNPELVAHVGEGDDPAAKSAALAIGKLDIDVDIVGDTAHTTVTAQFLNASPRALEGDFVFDMPPGSVVTGYALDINGAMVDGVLVGQRQAKLTFESRERRGIDPGIAEVTRSGAFMTRVFPIFENRGRTVRLEFVTPLEPGKPLVLPLATQQAVGAVSIHVHSDAAHAPALRGPDGIALAWTQSGSGFEAHGAAANLVLAGGLTVGPADAPALLLARHGSGAAFFEIDDVAAAASDAPVHPARLRLYWDSSLSRRDADLSKEIDLVGRYIAAAHPEIVDIVFFSSDAPHLRSFRAPSPEAIAAVLKTTDYQGGTSLKPLLKADWPAADACLLFSDGNVTVDAYRAVRLPCVLSTLSSAADANRALLTALAHKSGGDYIDLGVQSPDEALGRLMHRAARAVEVRGTDGQAIDFVLLPAAAGRFRVVGPLPASGGIVVTLTGAAVNTRHYDVPRNDIAEGDTLGALWAARHIDEMNGADRPDRDAMLALSRRYSIASTVASFAVFENLSDYLEAKAEPPATLGKAALAQYARMKAQADADAAKAQKARLDVVLKMWTDEKLWWQRDFKPVAVKKPGGRTQGAPFVPPPDVSMPPPPPPPPPAPAPVSNRADSRGGSAVESVVVTGNRVPAPRGPQMSVTIAPWNPDRPYIAALNATGPETYWSVYRAQEKQYGALPAFYLDAAEFLFRHGRADDAVKVALNALELPSADATTMTILADRLMRYGDEDRALWLYERLLYLEPDRPQPRRNLALALVTRAEQGGALAEPPAARRRDYERALGLLNEIVTHDWQEAFDGIEVISLMEANRIVVKLHKLGAKSVALDPRFVAMLDEDLRIILEWNTDETDMDLWVDEPTGERAIYNHPRTAIGGRLSNDMTNGYGPEQYLLHHAPNGTYTVRVNVYAADRLNPNGATTVRAHIFRNYGRADEREQTLELELKRGAVRDDAHLVGTVKVTGGS